MFWYATLFFGDQNLHQFLGHTWYLIHGNANEFYFGLYFIGKLKYYVYFVFFFIAKWYIFSAFKDKFIGYFLVKMFWITKKNKWVLIGQVNQARS